MTLNFKLSHYQTEDYVLSRRLYLYTGAIPRSPYEAEFVKFALSDAGQSIVKQVGFVALSLDAPQPPPQMIHVLPQQPGGV